MIKINLLPRTIYERRAVRNTAVLFGIVLVALIVAGITFTVKVRANVRDMEAKAAETEAWKARVEQIQAQASEVRGSIQPIKQKVDFIFAVLAYNEKFPKLYEETAKWTYEKVSYSQLSCDGQQLTIQARARNLDDLGRFLLNMYRATNLFTSVTISGVPGYPRSQAGTAMPPLGGEMESAMPQIGPGLGAITAGVTRRPEESWIEFSVVCTLREPIVAPSPTGAAAAAPAGQPGMPPAPGPMPEAMPGPESRMRQPMGGT